MLVRRGPSPTSISGYISQGNLMVANLCLIGALGPIQQFKARTLNDDRNNNIDQPATFPTSYKNLAWDVWDVIPTILENLPDDKKRCVVCTLPFAPVGRPLPKRSTVRPMSLYDPFHPLAHTFTQLLCDHRAHTICLFEWWSYSQVYTQ